MPPLNRQALMLAGVLGCLLGFYLWIRWEPDLPAPGSARAPGVQPVESVPGGPQTPEYDRLQGLADASRAHLAHERGVSAVPTPPTLQALRSEPPVSRSSESPVVPRHPDPPPPTAVAAVPPLDSDRLVADLARAMQTQAKELVAFREQRFNPRPTRMVTFEDVRGQRERAEARPRDRLGVAATPATGPRDRSGALQPGEILYAVLQTAINSDEPGPVRAKVTGERFRGAILLGNLRRFPPVAGSRPERVLVTFEALTTTDRTTHAIDAYAIDLATARTALATGVDHHYLSRWGSLIAASFLEGYGNAVRNSNRIATVGPLGTVISVPKDGIDDGQIAREALGTVGERLADAVGEHFQRPNTITVDAGTGIGVLIVTPVGDPREVAPVASSPPPPRTPYPTHRSPLFPESAPLSPVFASPPAPAE